METIITVIHVLAAAGVIGLVLLQHGKGADMGAAFGSGASGSLFGVSGSSNFLSRATAVFVAIFFSTSLGLAYLSSHKAEHSSVIDSSVIDANNKAAKAAAAAKPVDSKAVDAKPVDTKEVPQ